MSFEPNEHHRLCQLLHDPRATSWSRSPSPSRRSLRSRPRPVPARPGTATATALYITVTGIVYFFLLSPPLRPLRLALVCDASSITSCRRASCSSGSRSSPKGTLHLRRRPGLIIPLARLRRLHARPRAVSGFYPYPFVDVAKLGYARVARNIVGFVVFFSLVGAIYVLIDRVIEHSAGMLRRPVHLRRTAHCGEAGATGVYVSPA